MIRLVPCQPCARRRPSEVLHDVPVVRRHVHPEIVLEKERHLVPAQVDVPLFVDVGFGFEIEVKPLVLDGGFVWGAGIQDFGEDPLASGRPAQHFRNPSLEVGIGVGPCQLEDGWQDIGVLDKFVRPAGRNSAAAQHEGDVTSLPGKAFRILGEIGGAVIGANGDEHLFVVKVGFNE